MKPSVVDTCSLLFDAHSRAHKCVAEVPRLSCPTRKTLHAEKSVAVFESGHPARPDGFESNLSN
jgi:hypothetical protein